MSSREKSRLNYIMKHAILITAHNQFEYLDYLISLFDGDEDFYIYIQVDNKVSMNETSLIKLNKHTSVKRCMYRMKINWGGRNLLEGILELCKSAINDLKDEEFYIHNISGTDLLVTTLDDFKYFFEYHKGLNFMEYFSLPYDGWSNGGLDRLIWKHPLDRLNIRNTRELKIYKRYIAYQQRSGLYRKLPKIMLFGGGCWWSITKDAAIYLCKHYNDYNLYDRMDCVFGPEEILPQTILMNSCFCNKIENNNLRYISWDCAARGTPAIIEAYDIHKILYQNAFFARKIDVDKSKEVICFFNWYRNVIPFDRSKQSNDALHKLVTYIMNNIEKSKLFGIMSGLSGVCIFLFCYVSIFKDKLVLKRALSVLQHIINNRKQIRTFDFNNGTMGVAFTIAWLRNRNLISGDVDNLLYEFDLKVKSTLSKVVNRNENLDFYKDYFRFDLYVYERQINLEPEIMEKIVCAQNKCFTEFQFINSLNDRASLGLHGWSGYGLLLLNDYLPENFLTRIF